MFTRVGTVIGIMVGAVLVLHVMLRLAPTSAMAAARDTTSTFRISGQLILRDPLARPELPRNQYTVTAHIEDVVVGSWRLISSSEARPFALNVAVGADGVPSGTLVTFQAVDAQGIRARNTTTATVQAGAQAEREVVLDFRPNILVLVTDDQRYDQMPAMPLTLEHIFEAGVAFNRGYVSQSLCCPSRVSMWSGLYSHHTGVFNNLNSTVDLPTYPELLHDEGYFTGNIGKYTNSWTTLFGHAPRPEFDFWTDHPDYNYVTKVISGGNEIEVTRYGTYVVRDYALEFFEQAAARAGQPFMLTVNFRAPHAPAIPAPEDANLYSDLPPYRPPSYNAGNNLMAEKPLVYASRPRLLASQEVQLDQLRIDMLRTLASADRTIDALLGSLADDDQLANTLVFFISDNGAHLGEFRRTGKNTPYEEAIRVPFAIRFDRLVRWPRTVSTLAINVDLMPTILDVAGVTLPASVDGISLVPVLAATEPAHRVYLPFTKSASDLLPLPADILAPDPLTGRSYVVIHGSHASTDYVGLHTGRFVYLEHFEQISELYDLANDPYQLDNLIGDQRYAVVETQLRAQLAQERLQWGPRIMIYQPNNPSLYDGPVQINLPVQLLAVVTPETLPLPLTFTWQADDQRTMTHQVNGYRDSVTWTWDQRGYKQLTVTVTGEGFEPIVRRNMLQLRPSLQPTALDD